MKEPARAGVSALAALLVSLAVANPCAGQQVSKLPAMEEIFESSELRPLAISRGSWLPSGSEYAFLRPRARGKRRDLVVVDSESLEEQVLLRASDLSEALGRSVQIEDYQFSADRSRVIVFVDAERVWRRKTRGFYFEVDLETRAVTALGEHGAGLQRFGKLSPSGTSFGFVRDRNLYVVDLRTGVERPLTSDDPASGIINGTSDWVYEEELGLRDGWIWSPDSRRIAFIQFDESPVPDFAMTDFRTNYPEYVQFRWPAAGESNSVVRIGVVDVASGETRYLDTGTWHGSSGEFEYIAQFDWVPGQQGSKLWILRLNRDQNRMDVVVADVVTGQVTSLVREESRAWIRVKTGFSDLDTGGVFFLQDGQHFVLLSERDGYRHAFLYSSNGELVGQLTRGDWEVTGFHGIDLVGRRLLVAGTLDGPLERHLYEITWDQGTVPGSEGARIQRRTPEAGWHQATVSSTNEYFVDTFSSLDVPPKTAVRHADGRILHTLISNEDVKDRLRSFDLPHMELVEVPAADGTPLNAWFIQPTDFDSSATYPLLMYVYGGPGSQQVRNAWYSGSAERNLWHSMIVQRLGIVMVCADNRGTAGRGAEFKTITYRRLGHFEALDQVSAARHFAQQPFIDSDRVGIWGKSYGGYMTLLALLTGGGPNTFSVGVSVAPVTSWRLYDTIYTERYMGTPDDNPEGYAQSAPLAYAGGLHDNQRLLLIHGDLDDNVHVQNTMQMADRLQAEGKQFSMMLYPGTDHSLREDDRRLHVFTLITDFLKENLGSRDPASSGR